MEPVIECIIAAIEIVVSDLDNVEGSDFSQLICKTTEQYDQIWTQMSRLQDGTYRNQNLCQEVLSHLEKWNYQLRRVTDNVHMDQNVRYITALESNAIISLSNEERNFLIVKRDKRTKDLKYRIHKLIIKVDELIVSFDQKIEEICSDNVIIADNKTLFDEIEMRYKAAVTREHSTVTSEEMKDNKMESQISVKEEQNDKENTMKSDIFIKNEYNDNNDEEKGHAYNQDCNNTRSEVLRQSQSNNMNHKTEIQMTKDAFENIVSDTNKVMEKEQAKVHTQEESHDSVVWTKFRYTVTNGEFADMDVGCIISSCKDTLKCKDLVTITTKTADDIPLSLDASHEILSNIIQIEPAGLDVEFDNEYPWKISIPYLMIRNASKEIMIVCHDLTTGTNMNLETQELIFDDVKEGGFKLAEATLPSPSCICVVVCKRKIEKFRIDKRGNRFVSNIDPRVVLTMPQNSVKIRVNFEMSISQIESGYLNDLASKISLNNLYSMSPIVEIKSDYPRNLLKVASLQIPIPNVPVHSSRGRAASARSQTSDKMVKRSKSAITRQISTEEDPVIKVGVFNYQENLWRINNNLNFVINKNQDSVEIDLQNLNKQRLVVVRCDENFNDEHLFKSIDTINKGLETRLVQFIIRQHVDEPNRIVVITAHPNRMDKVQRALTQEHFSEETSLLSSEFTIRERSKLKIACKGNLEIEDKKLCILRYNSQLPNRKEFLVKEIDKFAQKSKDFYQGFVVITEPNQNNENKLWEAVINIPKTVVGNKKDCKDIDEFDFLATDIINKQYLRYLSQQLGKDWMSLGKSLKVAEVTIRRISNNPSIDRPTMAYECLLKWIKNATVYSNKVVVMEKALRSVGRFDLVQDLAKRVLTDPLS